MRYLRSLPAVGEVFATEQLSGLVYEYALTQGMLDSNPAMYGIGIRVKGSPRRVWESATCGYHMNPCAVLFRRFFTRCVWSRESSFEFLHPEIAQTMATILRKKHERAQKAQLKADAIAAEQRSQAEKFLAYRNSVDQVPLPKGKRLTLHPQQFPSLVNGTSYAGWFVAKLHNGTFGIFHMPSRMRVGKTEPTYGAALRRVRAFLKEGLSGETETMSEESLVIIRIIIESLSLETAPRWPVAA